MLTFSQARKELLAQQLMPVSAVMAGLCTVASALVKVVEGVEANTIADELFAGVGFVFCISLVFGFCAVFFNGRQGSDTDGNASIVIFIFGTFLMCVACVLYACDTV